MNVTPQASGSATQAHHSQHDRSTDSAQSIAGDENSPRRAMETALELTDGTREEQD